VYINNVSSSFLNKLLTKEVSALLSINTDLKKSFKHRQELLSTSSLEEKVSQQKENIYTATSVRH